MNFEKVRHFIRSKKARDFLIYGFGQAVNLISPIIIVPFVIMICGEAGLGKIGVGFSLAILVNVWVDYGSYINGTREIATHVDQHDCLEERFLTIYGAKFILLCLFLVLAVLLIFTVPFFRSDYTQLLLSLVMVVGQFVNPTWFLQGVQNFVWITLINVISRGIYILTVILFVAQPEDYQYVNMWNGVGLIIPSLFGMVYILRHHKINVRNFQLRRSIALLREEFSLTLSQVFFAAYQFTPVMIVSYFCGNFVAGQYRVIEHIVMIFRTYLQTFYNFIYPEICKQIDKSQPSGIRFWFRVNGINYFIVVIMLTGIFFNTAPILRFFKVTPAEVQLLSGNFQLGLVIPVLLGLTFAVRQLLFAFNSSYYYVRITILATITYLILMIFLLQKMGLAGAFVATIIIELFIIISYFVILKKMEAIKSI
ncbi:lipopolysaccharide biosynthesis protein [Flavobacterium sp.]|uniref:lipopolysaccharide biosynthesis protein n=1 Tax=Flavobacterium sp. TaxID=239 RepID=UPI00333E9979